MNDQDKRPVLFLRDIGFASDAPNVTIVAINSQGRPQVLLNRSFVLNEFERSKAGSYYLIKEGFGYAQCGGSIKKPGPCSYEPELVYEFLSKNGEVKFEYNERLSKKLNADHGYPWHGSQFSTKIDIPYEVFDKRNHLYLEHQDGK